MFVKIFKIADLSDLSETFTIFWVLQIIFEKVKINIKKVSPGWFGTKDLAIHIILYVIRTQGKIISNELEKKNYFYKYYNYFPMSLERLRRILSI